MPTENQSRVAATPPMLTPVCELTHKSIETLGMMTLGDGTLSGINSERRTIEREGSKEKEGHEEMKEILELPTLGRKKAPVTPQLPMNSTNQYS